MSQSLHTSTEQPALQNSAEKKAKQAYRLMNRDGTFNTIRVGEEQNLFSDVYHRSLMFNWKTFFVMIFTGYCFLNLIFALLYFSLGIGAIEGAHQTSSANRFLDCLFFSVQTFATIGYGKLTPHGVLANTLVTVEAVVGLLSVALATGLLFSRFSRPDAKVIFSDKCIVGMLDGEKSLYFRLANRRRSQIVEARFYVALGVDEKTAEGVVYRNFYKLELEREFVPFFGISFTIVHPINEKSPFFNKTSEDLRRMNAEMVVALNGTDDIFSQSIHSRFSYAVDDFLWNHRFEDMLSRTQDGKILVELGKMNEVVELG